MPNQPVSTEYTVIQHNIDQESISNMSSPSISEFSSASFMSNDMTDEPITLLSELAISEKNNDSEESPGSPLSLTSFNSIIEKLPGLVLEDNIYHIKSPLLSAQLADLISYCKRVHELTLTDAQDDQYPQISPNTLVRLSRIEDPEFPFLASLKRLHLVDADLSLCYLIFCVTPSLECLKISGIPQSHQVTITCFLEDLAYNAPELASMTLGPGLLSPNTLKTSLEFTHLRHLHIEDAAASLDFDFFHGIACLPELESFFIDARSTEYIKRADFSNGAPLEKLFMSFPCLLKLTVISNVVVMGDLICHLFPRAIKDVSLTMVRTDPPQSEPPFSQDHVHSGAKTPIAADPVDRREVITSNANAEPRALLEPASGEIICDVATPDDRPTSLSIIDSLTGVVRDFNMKPFARLTDKQLNNRPLFRSTATRLAEAEYAVQKIAAEPEKPDMPNISNSKMIRQLSAEAGLTAARLVLAKVEVGRIVLKQEKQKRKLAKKVGYTEEKRLQLEVIHQQQLQIAAECEAQLAAEHDRQIRLVAERQHRLDIEQERHLQLLEASEIRKLAAKHDQDIQLRVELEQRLVADIASQTADFAMLIQRILELGKLESIDIAYLDMATRESDVNFKYPAEFPASTLEKLLSNPTLVRLEIKDWTLTCVDDIFLNWAPCTSCPSSSMQTLRLPLEGGLNSGITLPTLRVIALRFPWLLEFQSPITAAADQPFVFDMDEEFACHGLDKLSIASVGGSPVMEDKVAVATFVWSLFPHLTTILARDERDAEDWRFVHKLIKVCQKAQAKDHELCCHVGAE